MCVENENQSGIYRSYLVSDPPLALFLCFPQTTQAHHNRLTLISPRTKEIPLPSQMIVHNSVLFFIPNLAPPTHLTKPLSPQNIPCIIIIIPRDPRTRALLLFSTHYLSQLTSPQFSLHKSFSPPNPSSYINHSKI